MQLVDLSRDIYHKMPRLPNHPSVIITTYSTHDEIREAEGVTFSTATLALAMGDHAGTHVDAPAHFDSRPDAMTIDQIPLENFFTEAVCLDLSHKPLKSDIRSRTWRKPKKRRGSRSNEGTRSSCIWIFIAVAMAVSATSLTFRV
jgi:kynurenine formamidase